MISTNESAGLGFHRANQTHRSALRCCHTPAELLIHICAFLSTCILYGHVLDRHLNDRKKLNYNIQENIFEEASRGLIELYTMNDLDIH